MKLHEVISVNFYPYLLYLVAISIPLSNQINSASIIIYSLYSVLLFIKSPSIFSRTNNKLRVLSLSFYFLLIISYFVSENKEIALFSLEQKLSLIIFPIFMVPSLITDKMYYYCLKFFVYSNLSLSILALIIGSLNFISNNFDTNFLFYHQLSTGVGLHAIYFAIYLFICIAIIDLHKDLFKELNKFILNTLVTFIYIMIFLLSSKIVWGIVMAYLIYKYLYKELKQRNIKKILIGSSLILIFLLLLLKIPYTKNRIFETSLKEVSVEDGKQNGISARLTVWKYSYYLIKDNPFLGVGTGDTDVELNKLYDENNFNVGKDLKLNAHNQYIQTSLELGFTGLLILLIILFILLKYSVKDNNIFAIVFIITLLICFITESTLNTQKGIVFLSFFASLIFAKSTNKLTYIS